MWGPRSRGRGRMGRRNNFGILLLAMQMAQMGFDHIPPVTLGTIALNVGIYLGLVHQFFARHMPRWQEVCVGVVQVWNGKDYWRMVESAFHHSDDMHLYFNMVSFLWKGRWLENRIGTKRFLVMIAVFTVLVNAVLLYLNYAAAIVFQDSSYMTQCAIGFSGVCFAVKVVTTQLMPPGTQLFMGFIPVNSRLACWFELVLIQLIVPNASFTWHLAGILVGLAYVKGPLKYIMDLPFSGSGRRNWIPSNRPSYTYYSSTTGTTNTAGSQSNTEAYTGGLTEEEQIRIATEESLNHRPTTNNQRLYPDLDQDETRPSAPPDETQPPPYGWNIPDSNHHLPQQPDAVELRRRRLDHYSMR